MVNLLEYNVTRIGLHSVTSPLDGKDYVEPGDLIGFYSKEHGIIPYDRQLSPDPICLQADICFIKTSVLNIGDNVTCSGVAGYGCRFYSIFATYKEIGELSGRYY